MTLEKQNLCPLEKRKWSEVDERENENNEEGSRVLDFIRLGCVAITQRAIECDLSRGKSQIGLHWFARAIRKIVFWSALFQLLMTDGDQACHGFWSLNASHTLYVYHHSKAASEELEIENL